MEKSANRAGQVLLEVLLAVLVLSVVLPHVPRASEKLVGYDPAIMEWEIKVNQSRIEMATINREIAVVEKNAKHALREVAEQRARTAKAKHDEAMWKLENYSSAEKSELERIRKEQEYRLKRRLTQAELDDLILMVWQTGE
jgi:hypothetical protein